MVDGLKDLTPWLFTESCLNRRQTAAGEVGLVSSISESGILVLGGDSRNEESDESDSYGSGSEDGDVSEGE